jgi:2,4-dienoyl-CoA reductase (NADPH2)
MRLLEPFQLAGRTARNRLIFGPHVTNLCRGRAFSDDLLAYYSRRARGGCGTVVAEEAPVHASDWPYEYAPSLDLVGEGWSRFAFVMHEEGALALASIGHTGAQGSSAYSQRELFAPSPVPDVVTREVPKEMEQEDIDAVLAGFHAAAAKAAASGVDGVEINAGQHSLVRQFLSSLTNFRSDGYGADRLRFAREVLEYVRAGFSAGIVGLRLSCDELAPWGGLSAQTTPEVVGALSPFCDYLVVSAAGPYTPHYPRPDMQVAEGFTREVAKLAREAAGGNTAIAVQGSIVSVDMAEEIVATGVADFVEMTRAQIADPDLATKIGSGRRHRVRPCVLCNQACQVRDGRNRRVSCIGEPAAGHELREADPATMYFLPPAADAAVIVVRGAGPAGLEAARVAALAGRHVRLIETNSVCGGAVRTAAAGRGRSRLARLAEWLEAECRELEVGIELSAAPEEATADLFAIGGEPATPDYTVEGDGLRVAERVLEDMSRGRDPGLPDGSLLIWDPVGGPVAVSLAITLASRHLVTLATPDAVAASMVAATGDLAAANARLMAAGVIIKRGVRLAAVGPGWVDLESRVADIIERVEVASVVDAGFRRPRSVQRVGGRVAGDAVAPRTILEAILEGRRAGLALAAT